MEYALLLMQSFQFTRHTPHNTYAHRETNEMTYKKAGAHTHPQYFNKEIFILL